MRVCCSRIRRFRRTHRVPMVWRSDRKLAGHFEQLIVQRADKLGGLWGIASIHTGGVAQLAFPKLRNGSSVHDPLNTTKTPGHRSPTSGRPAAKAGRKLSVSRACHISGSTPRILANVLGLKALVVPLKLNSSERRRMLVSGLKIRPVSVRVRLGAHETAAQRPSAPDGTALSPAAVRSASAVDSVTASKASAIRPRSSGNRCP